MGTGNTLTGLSVTPTKSIVQVKEILDEQMSIVRSDLRDTEGGRDTEARREHIHAK